MSLCFLDIVYVCICIVYVYSGHNFNENYFFINLYFQILHYFKIIREIIFIFEIFDTNIRSFKVFHARKKYIYNNYSRKSNQS